MSERYRGNPEGGREYIPSREEVLSLFEQLVDSKKYTTRREHKDGQGLYLWEITISGEDGDTEYLYMRKGEHEVGGQASETAIHVAFFDETGYPVGGHSVAKHVDGKWKLTP